MRKTTKTVDEIKQHLFDALGLEDVGIEGLIVRFTAAELRVFASRAGQLTRGNKRELAARLIAAGRQP